MNWAHLSHEINIDLNFTIGWPVPGTNPEKQML
jgi:hypothetical protein